MAFYNRFTPSRRDMLRSTISLFATGMLGKGVPAAEAQSSVKNVNKHSSPSTLKITDMRYTVVKKPGPSPCPIIRIDTNQGVYGLGEVRDVANYQYAMVLKNRIVGENPLNVDFLFEKIAQFGGISRQAGGVVAVEMALWDIVGKVYGIPIYQMLGGKWRDKIRIYADTPEADTPKEFAAIAKERKDRGLTWIKVDIGTDLLKGKPGTIMEPADQRSVEYDKRLPHAFTGNELTDKGIDVYCEYMATIREAIGYEIPLSTDHLGHLGVKSIIRLGRAYEKYNLEWIEDVIPWWYTDLLKEITDAIPTPTITGEDIYEIADFERLCSVHAVDKIHPDLSTSGGILRTHKIGDMAYKYGVPMAMHFAGTPVACMANVHCAAATRNFLALENHSLDVPWWQDMVNEVDKPIINRGYITVPDTPGLGVTLNDEVVRQHLAPGVGYFEPTPMWDEKQSFDDQLFS